MEGVLALMIPVLAMSIGLVRVLRMPPEALASRRYRRQLAAAPQSDTALIEEVTQLREEVARLHERVDFTERLLSPAPAAFTAPAAHPASSPMQ